jgi:hypothetical protein
MKKVIEKERLTKADEVANFPQDSSSFGQKKPLGARIWRETKTPMRVSRF